MGSGADRAAQAEVVNALRAWFSGRRCVLFDFDGPVCRLFPEDASRPVADRLRGLLEQRGELGLLSAEEREDKDPHTVLRAVGRLSRDHDGLVAELDELLTEGEARAAVDIAWPTAGVAEILAALALRGHGIAMVTNNSPRAAGNYVQRERLSEYFGDGKHIYGRGEHPSLLKPHPDCVLRALSGLGAAAGDALLIGDTVADLAAARAANVRFLGYARNADKERRLRAAGARLVISSYEPLLAAVGGAPS